MGLKNQPGDTYPPRPTRTGTPARQANCDRRVTEGVEMHVGGKKPARLAITNTTIPRHLIATLPTRMHRPFLGHSDTPRF